MKFKKNMLIATCTLLCSYAGIAQTRPLAIGDKIPDITINRVVNFKTAQVRLSDFKGKLLILDFWATWCAPCISMLPVCDSLQQAFKNNLQVLPVSQQSRQTITAFITNIQKVKQLSFPSVTEDTLLNSLFPHTEIPYYVWIGKTGKVIAITGAEKINRETVDEYLQTGTITLETGTRKFRKIDEKQPMFRVANELIEDSGTRVDVLPGSKLFYHSVLTGYMDGFGCETGGDTNRIICKNNTIGSLYRYALSGLDMKKLFLNSTVWKVSDPMVLPYTDSAAVTRPSKPLPDDWIKQHTFCYELKYPDVSFGKKAAIMLQELNNYFGTAYNIVGGLEKVNTTVLALVKTDSNHLYASKGISAPSQLNTFYLRLLNQPVAALTNALAGEMDMLPPLVDETGYTGNIDIELACDLTSLEDVNKALAAYGLALQEKQEVMEMIVIKDKL